MLSILSILFSFTYKKKKEYINNNIYIVYGLKKCGQCGKIDVTHVEVRINTSTL